MQNNMSKGNIMTTTNKIQYKHIRPVDEMGRYKNRGGLTIAYRETGENTIEYRVAYCSKNDNFCRKTGRTIAERRLNIEPMEATLNTSPFHILKRKPKPTTEINGSWDTL